MKMDRQQLRQLNSIKEIVHPDQLWVTENKEQLLRTIGATVVSHDTELKPIRNASTALRIFISERMMSSLKPAMSVIMALVIATGGWIASVNAAFNSVPGDVLWSVKLASEKTQLAVASLTQSNKEEAQLYLKFAHRRAKEFEKVIEAAAPDSAKNAETAINHLKDSLQSADASLRRVEAGNAEEVKQVFALAQDVTQATQAISETLAKGVGTVTGSDLAKAVVATEKVNNEVGLSAVEVVVQKQTEAGVVIDAAVRGIVEEKIQKLIGTAVEDVQKIKDLATVSSTTVGAVTTSVQLWIPVMSSTPANLPTVIVSNTLAVPIQEVAKKADKTVSEVKEDTKEIRSLLDGKQLLEAIQKTKQLNEAVTQVKEAAVEAAKGVASSTVSGSAAINPINSK